ncbi:hypothetical protein GM921_05035 [Pedobacter sp. LMG 31464]|uniref:Bacteriocin resistance YdeI/OmpD-like protein n=1 Tax=Pedobacter planticolens TaxID=2679964 RepID=A0A923IW63_9SPHI|nr:YdeI/OmpD-associated family protein [Pedobacter planticolens]MBB2144837.1 hypothetical protein [Pedobacter planticolens]
MENPLFKKLYIKTGNVLCIQNAPENVLSILGDIPEGIKLTKDLGKPFDELLLFVKDSTELTQELKEITVKLQPTTLFWILYPKKSSNITSDLNMMAPWDELKTHQLTPCASAAINDTWTALRIKPLELVKSSGICNDDIQKNEYGNFVDVVNKIITLPEDLKSELEKSAKALNFFEQLSYSNRKEYILWILTAKQEKTRTDRISKTIEKLIAGKKNPSEK